MYNNSCVVLVSKEVEELEKEEETYNFEVEDNHNYFVGESLILVHNDCSSPDDLDPVQECSKGHIPNIDAPGQRHHVIGTRPFEALEDKYKAGLNRNHYIARAKTLKAHYGYQDWHRLLNDRIIGAVQESANLASFETALNEIYTDPETVTKFGRIIIKL